MKIHLGRRSARTTGIAIAMLALATAGCQTYRRAPIDLPAHRAVWAGRSPESNEVRNLAARLAAASPSAGPHFDAADGLSLAEAEAVALVYNADLRLARLRAAEAAASARHAGLWEDPVFGFDGERILNDVAHPWIAAASLGITLPFSGRLDAETRQASAEQRAAIARVVAEEWAIRTRLRTRWLAWSFESLRVELTRSLLERLGGIVGIAGRMEEAGELSRIEGRLFRAEQASRRIELRALESRAAALEIELREAMGLVPDAPVVLVHQTAIEPPAAPPTPEEIEHTPQMCALRAAYDVAEETLRLEIAEQFPDLAIAPGYRREDGDARATLGIELPIPAWNRNQRGIAEAKARRELARAEVESAYEALVSKAAAVEVQRSSAAAQRAEIEASLIPMVDEQAADVQRVAELGQVDTLVMLDTLVRQHEAKLKLLDARLQEAEATIRLQELAGPCRPLTEGTP